MNLRLHTHKEFTELKTDKDNLVSKLQGAETELTNLKNMSKDMTEAQAEHETKMTALKVEHDTAITALKAEHTKALNEMKAGYDKQISGLTTKTEQADASSEAKARQVLAQIGVPADEVPKVNTKNIEAPSILDGAKDLNPQQLTDYLATNKMAIYAELQKKKAKKTVKDK